MRLQNITHELYLLPTYLAGTHLRPHGTWHSTAGVGLPIECGLVTIPIKIRSLMTTDRRHIIHWAQLTTDITRDISGSLS